MNLFGNSHSAPPQSRKFRPALGFDAIRVYLGVGLAVRGILFLADPTLLDAVLDQGRVGVSRAIGVAHFAGGLLLAAGLFTRLAATAQAVPVLGALLLSLGPNKLASADQSVEFTGLVLALLVVYSSYGAGPMSLDHRWRNSSAH